MMMPQPPAHHTNASDWRLAGILVDIIVEFTTLTRVFSTSIPPALIVPLPPNSEM